MLVPANVTIAWQSQYAGPHRVCYRIVGAPAYICTVPGTPGPGFNPVCLGGGNPCSYDITIMVDDETCDQIDYEGYVQSACEDEASTVGRIPFTFSFIPSPACARYEVTCENSPVLDTTITDGGTGYTDGVYPGLPSVGGGGTLATFDVTVAGGIVTGIVIGAVGSGYTSAPTIDMTSIPFTPGTLATITVNLRGCGALNKFDCSGTSTPLPIGTFQPGETIFECYEGTPPEVPSDYTRSAQAGNCLCNCIEQNIQATFDGGSIDYGYIDCNGNNVIGTLTNIDETGAVCMVDGSLETTVNAPAVLNIVVVGPCNAVPVP